MAYTPSKTWSSCAESLDFGVCRWGYSELHYSFNSGDSYSNSNYTKTWVSALKLTHPHLHPTQPSGRASSLTDTGTKEHFKSAKLRLSRCYGRRGPSSSIGCLFRRVSCERTPQSNTRSGSGQYHLPFVTVTHPRCFADTGY